MKLINTDELKQKMEKHIVRFPSDIYTDGKNWGIEDCIEDLEKMPSVKAIPKEWIRDYMLRLPDGSEAYECILVMLENWEKENERP